MGGGTVSGFWDIVDRLRGVGEKNAGKIKSYWKELIPFGY